MPETIPQRVARLGGILLTGSDGERQGAAQKLKELGSQGFSALPALVMALSQRNSDKDTLYRYELAGAILAVCGGTDTLVSAITRLFSNADPRIRVGAAGTLGFLPAFNEVLCSPEPLSKDFGSTVPMLCAYAVSDPSPDVRGQCLVSLLRLVTRTPNAPWERGMNSLATALGTTRIGERQLAAQVLALFPVSLWPICSLLRSHLHDPDKTTRISVRMALYHVAVTDRTRLTNVLLADLHVGGKPAQRASGDLLALASSLWIGVYHNQDENLPRAQSVVSNWLPRNLQSTSFDTARRLQTESQNLRLLDGMTTAVRLPDRAVRVTLARALVIIAEGTNGLLGQGIDSSIELARLPRLLSALDTATATVRTTDPALAQRLIAQRRRLTQPRAIIKFCATGTLTT